MIRFHFGNSDANPTPDHPVRSIAMPHAGRDQKKKAFCIGERGAQIHRLIQGSL